MTNLNKETLVAHVPNRQLLNTYQTLYDKQRPFISLN